MQDRWVLCKEDHPTRVKASASKNRSALLERSAQTTTRAWEWERSRSPRRRSHDHYRDRPSFFPRARDDACVSAICTLL